MIRTDADRRREAKRCMRMLRLQRQVDAVMRCYPDDSEIAQYLSGASCGLEMAMEKIVESLEAPDAPALREAAR
jgi:ribosomal protein L30/L7E